MALLSLLLFTLYLISLTTAQTNLPSVPPGVFSASARIEIATTVPLLWTAVANFSAYPEWNPFVRSAIVTNALAIPLPAPQQWPTENARLFFRVQIPPLPLPVNASTPDNPAHTQTSFENITHVQPTLGRVAWKLLSPDLALEAERWTAVSVAASGNALYESREVYRGALAGVLEGLYGAGLQAGFEAQAEALRGLLEK
ncbi:uncharacterized protein BDZ99DRAFT_515733 [Mytilinidion resinicola]|uniref:Coenzyme Q-binding protein COQ10 START domain-containing protein n=1 Tax=Mytilinidion resinicola TaxID=574789 RepID=A0A6A6Z1U5_9PEZI|nr:uncharacterized protein BDZ99DRAFT_515733 [Mytilinidion resinicola]KAF2814970.1 hypothetical protein BDZ99DRAFT_515733 [Mytilinidion resinicola]